MNEEQMATRKNWLRMLVLLFLMEIVYSAVMTPKDPNFILMPSWGKALMVSCSVLPSAAVRYLIYYCAYKKPGTKLLTFLLVATPIALGGSAAFYILVGVPLPQGSWFWAYSVLDMGFSLWFYFLNWKMRAINKGLQALKGHAQT